MSTPGSKKPLPPVIVPAPVGGLRLVSVVANPSGQDEGREKFTLLNVLDGEPLNLKGWKVVGPNQSFFVLGDVVLKAGEARTFTIPARGSLQLSNKGGIITVLDPSGSVAQSVDYDRSQASVQGAVLIWNGATSLVQIPALVRK